MRNASPSSYFFLAFFFFFGAFFADFFDAFLAAFFAAFLAFLAFFFLTAGMAGAAGGIVLIGSAIGSVSGFSSSMWSPMLLPPVTITGFQKLSKRSAAKQRNLPETTEGDDERM